MNHLPYEETGRHGLIWEGKPMVAACAIDQRRAVAAGRCRYSSKFDQIVMTREANAFG
ncbi:MULTISPECIES: hypothetical protein [unclassified Dyella]|uniref:hypothetical protein n=1 Tax=unclassified Dyella TaxID=2634549 RepID=UPI0013046E27|nr:MULTISPECIES: hypothetical protein [unclassified Dyella]MDR3447760.1 hypothetical protein [Dyella sp.]